MFEFLRRSGAADADQSWLNQPQYADETEHSNGQIWLKRRLLLAMMLLLIAGVYPLMIVLSSRIPNTLPAEVPVNVWADPKIGASVELLEHELDVSGWAASQPNWHPQSRLTAMPAFQQGMADVIASFAAKRSELLSGPSVDSDLEHAQSLLARLDTQNAEDKLHAAIEALRRFDGRKARDLLEDRSADELLSGDLRLFSQIATDSALDLRQIASEKSRGFFNRDVVASYYRTKGKLYMIGLLMRATRSGEMVSPELNEALNTVNAALSRAVKPSPLTVSNPQPGSFSLGGNDVITLAFLAEEAAAAMRDMSEAGGSPQSN